MTTWNPRANDLFLKALELRSSEERRKFLDQECADDAPLRSEVESLLEAGGRAAGFLESPANAAAVTMDQPVVEGPGAMIGPYKLLEQIGEGGFGAVFLAEQFDPVRRKVALKVLKPGIDTRQVVARFEAERQALAIMDHPNIARVFDGGATPSGRPYFVMELVKGVPITDFCDRHHLNPRQRLELFVAVCHAIQHAHQKGIIHRDLKPSNVLVSRHDATPVVKVIDFGVAKALGQELTDKTLFTGLAQMIGTPLYMSPEQAGMSDLDVDTRSDIYSLGVLLYELLTGTTPFSRERFRKAAFDEIRRIIREEEPPSPSTRLSTAEELPSIAAQRQTEPAKLTRLVRGELDWIVMKALEKDRSRRYETANGFAADVQRYLADEPVLACPPSATYRLKKFLQRNQGPVVAVSLVLLALVAGIIGTGWGMFRAEERRQDAELAWRTEARERARAEQSAEAEKQARNEAQARLGQLEKANNILVSVFRNLDPRFEKKEAKPLRAILGDRLDMAAAALEGEAVGDPLMVARLQGELAVCLVGLGYSRPAIALLEKARATQGSLLGRDHHETLISMNNLGHAYQDVGRLEESLAIWEESLKLRKAKFGADHPDTLVGMANLAMAYRSVGRQAEALSLLEQTLELMKAKLGPDDRDTLSIMNNLAIEYSNGGRLGEAVRLHEETLKRRTAKLGPEHLDTIDSMITLGQVYQRANRSADAIVLYEKSLKLMRANHGHDHPHTLSNMHELATAYDAMGRRPEALTLYEETVKLKKVRLGLDHRDTLQSMNSLGVIYQAAGRPAESVPLLVETLRLRKDTLGPEHPETLQSMNSLAVTYLKAGRRPEALPLLEEALKLQRIKPGPDHFETLLTMHNLAGAYRDAGRLAEALPLYEETLKRREATLGGNHPKTLLSMEKLAAAYELARRPNDAVPLYEKLWQLRQAELGLDHPETLIAMGTLAMVLDDAGRRAESVALNVECVKLSKAKVGPDHPSTILSVNNLAFVYLSDNKLDLALPLFQEAVAGIEKGRYTHAHAGQIIGNLRECHERLKQYDQAETWQRKWLAVVKERSGATSTIYAGELSTLALNLFHQKKFSEAEPVLRECLGIRERLMADAWQTFNTKSMLGGALLGQKKFAEAEPLLVQGYEGMKQREAKIPSPFQVRLTEALQRLVQVYEGLDKKEAAAKWQKVLDERKAVKTPGKPKGQ